MNYDFLAKTPLFQGYQPEQMNSLILRLEHHVKKFDKESLIFQSGTKVKELGILISGSIRIENIDILGNRNILGIAETGDVFAESYACTPGQPLLVDVVAGEASAILFLNVERLFQTAGTNEDSQRILINLLRIASKKNQNLSMRIFHSSPKKIRDRLLSYFSEQVKLQGDMHIKIPLDRQQLADYLNVDRTALSKELGKMKKEGLIDFRKNDFVLHFHDPLW